MCQIPLDFGVLFTKSGGFVETTKFRKYPDFVLTRKRACPPKGYTYPVVLKQQHERENTVAFASICGP